MAKEPNNYAEVIAERKRGLAINDPVDSLDDVMDESRFMSVGSFIESCQRRLRELIWNSHLVTIKDTEVPIGKADEVTHTEEVQNKGSNGAGSF